MHMCTKYVYRIKWKKLPYDTFVATDELVTGSQKEKLKARLEEHISDYYDEVIDIVPFNEDKEVKSPMGVNLFYDVKMSFM